MDFIFIKCQFSLIAQFAKSDRKPTPIHTQIICQLLAIIMNDMFCFQCEQTAGCTGCTRAGVCGKTADIANFQDELTGALIALSDTQLTAANSSAAPLSDAVCQLILDGLFATITNVNFDGDSINKLTAQIRHEKEKLADTYQVLASADYDMTHIWNANEDIRSLKSLILFGIRGIAAYAYHAMVLGYTDASLNQFFVTALSSL